MKAILEHLKRGDARLGGLIERVGECRMPRYEAEFGTLAGSILSQQLSAKAAATIRGRLVAAMGEEGLTPAGVLKLTVEEMRGLGLSRPKASYIHSLAELTLAGAIDFGRVGEMEDGAVIEHLTQAKGVGVWTAQMFLMFALGRRDVLPVADLGIRNAMVKLYGLKKAPDAKRMEKIAKPWRPYASVACWYLWQSLEE